MGMGPEQAVPGRGLGMKLMRWNGWRLGAELLARRCWEPPCARLWASTSKATLSSTVRGVGAAEAKWHTWRQCRERLASSLE